MFIVTLTFSENKSLAPEYMAEHNSWIQKGVEEGVFLIVGGLATGDGGLIVAHNQTVEELNERISNDPFVRENVVIADVTEFKPGKTDPRLNFLLADS